MRDALHATGWTQHNTRDNVAEGGREGIRQRRAGHRTAHAGRIGHKSPVSRPSCARGLSAVGFLEPC